MWFCFAASSKGGDWLPGSHLPRTSPHLISLHHHLPPPPSTSPPSPWISLVPRLVAILLIPLLLSIPFPPPTPPRVPHPVDSRLPVTARIQLHVIHQSPPPLHLPCNPLCRSKRTSNRVPAPLYLRCRPPNRPTPVSRRHYISRSALHHPPPAITTGLPVSLPALAQSSAKFRPTFSNIAPSSVLTVPRFESTTYRAPRSMLFSPTTAMHPSSSASNSNTTPAPAASPCARPLSRTTTAPRTSCSPHYSPCGAPGSTRQHASAVSWSAKSHSAPATEATWCLTRPWW